MKLTVKVIPSASRDRIEPDLFGRLKVHLTAKPVRGAANAALIKLLSQYFKVPQSAVTILKGRSNRTKIISIR